MLKRLHVKGYKSLVDVELSLAPLTLLIGPNASGKSNLLDALHPRRIELIAELLRTQRSLGQTQYIVTTHSPRLPDLLADDSLFVVRRRNGQTRIDPLAAWGPVAEWGRPGRAEGILQALDDEDQASSTSERILRGDFDE